MSDTADNMIMVAAIMGAHGVRGQVKLKVFTEDPYQFAQLSPVHFGEEGEPVKVLKSSVHKPDVLIATLEGIPHREAAQALKGTQLFVPRARFPEVEDEDDFYLDDLEGLQVLDEAQNLIGTVSKVSNFGAADVLEVALEGSGKTVMVPFITDAVPQVDVEAGHLLIDPAFIS